MLVTRILTIPHISFQFFQNISSSVVVLNFLTADVFYFEKLLLWKRFRFSAETKILKLLNIPNLNYDGLFKIFWEREQVTCIFFFFEQHLQTYIRQTKTLSFLKKYYNFAKGNVSLLQVIKNFISTLFYVFLLFSRLGTQYRLQDHFCHKLPSWLPVQPIAM